MFLWHVVWTGLCVLMLTAMVYSSVPLNITFWIYTAVWLIAVWHSHTSNKVLLFGCACSRKLKLVQQVRYPPKCGQQCAFLVWGLKRLLYPFSHKHDTSDTEAALGIKCNNALLVGGCAWRVNPIANHTPTLACVYRVSQSIVMVFYAWLEFMVRLQRCSTQARLSQISVMMHYDDGKSTLEHPISL